MANKPNTWRKVALVDLCEVHVDCVNRTAPIVDDPTPFKMIRTTNVRDGFIDTENVRYVTEPIYKKWTRRLVPKRGDVILTREAPLGCVGKVRTDDHIFLGQRLYHFRANINKLDPDFLLYALMADDLQGQIRGFGSGATVEHMRLGDIPELQVYAPDVSEQRRIGSILSAYDELIENCQRRIKILEQMARNLYREWFVHFRFPNHAKAPMVDSPLGKIPKGWFGSFGDLAAIVRESINPFEFPDEFFEHFSIPAFDKGCQPSRELGKSILSAKFRIYNSCVLLSKLNPRIPRVWLPAPIGQNRAVTSTEFLVLQTRQGLTPEFIYAKCCSDEFAAQFGSLAIGTSTSHQRVKPDNLLAMPSIVPSKDLVGRFSELVAPILNSSQRLREKTNNLRKTRDLLLPRLLSGQINVN